MKIYRSPAVLQKFGTESFKVDEIDLSVFRIDDFEWKEMTNLTPPLKEWTGLLRPQLVPSLWKEFPSMEESSRIWVYNEDFSNYLIASLSTKTRNQLRYRATFINGKKPLLKTSDQILFIIPIFNIPSSCPSH